MATGIPYRRKVVLLGACLGLCLAASPAWAVTLGQVDTFQDGTVMFWSGAPGRQSNVSTGGPAGAGDRYLRVTSDGSPFSGGKMATFNTAQWSGNYLAAGVKVVMVDFRNEGANPLTMRMVVFDQFAGTQWVSTASQLVPADGVWRRYTYVLAESQMTRTVGTETFANTISNANRLMFRHEAGAPSSQGTAIAAQLGIDNIAALAGAQVGPSFFSVDVGLLTGGGLAQLQTSNNDYVHIQNDETVPDATLRCEGTSPLASASAVSIEVESATSRPDMFLVVQLWDFSTSDWTTVANGTMQTTDTTLSARIVFNPNRFIGPSRLVRMRAIMFTVSEVNGFDGWAQRIDMVRWTIEP